MSAPVFQRVPVGAVQARYAHAGPADDPTAVVFVHGNPGSADDWRALVGEVGEHGRAVALDMPDFGETAAAPGFQHTVDGYAAFLGEALAALGVARVHLVVHDFGGPFGLTWAGKHPDALASVTLIDTGFLPGYRWHVLARIWRTPVLGEVFQATTTRRGFRWLVSRGEPQGLPRPFIEGMYDHYGRRTKRAVLKLYRSTNDPSGDPEIARTLGALDIPALVIWGEHDRYLPASHAARQRDVFPSADVHVLPASGHWPQADAPDTVQRCLVEFLAPQLVSAGPSETSGEQTARR